MITFIFFLISQSESTDVLSSGAFLQGIITGVVISIVGQIVSGVIQHYHQGRQHELEKERLQMQLDKTTENLEKQLKSTTENLEKQFEQSEKNLKIQLKQSEDNIAREFLIAQQVESINALWSIIYGAETYQEMKDSLNKLLDEPLGYYLPKTLYDIVRKETEELDKFIYETELEAGMVAPELPQEYYEQSWAQWWAELEPHERAEIDVKSAFKRFKSKLKTELRKTMSK